MGGMASVWRAHDERTGELVAIKRLHPHLIADEGARERFRREAAAMEAIRHPNVVAVRDAVVDADEPALVMDFVAGRSVGELAADGHAFDEAEALRIAAAVADGLAAVHELGIVHRDLKPANIILASDPEVGEQRYDTPAFHLSASPAQLRPVPTLGQDNAYVFKGLLGLSDAEYEALEREGVFE